MTMPRGRHALPRAAASDSGATSMTMQARAVRRLRRLELALCGLAQPALNCVHVAIASAECAPLALQAGEASLVIGTAGLEQPRLWLAARALSGMLCDESHALRYRVTVRPRRCQPPSQLLS